VQLSPQAGREVTLQQVRDAWPEILEIVKNAKMSAWMVLATAQVRELREGSVLVLSFPSRRDVDALKQQSAPGQGVGDLLKQAVSDLLGIRPGLIAKTDEGKAPAPRRAVGGAATPEPAPTTSGDSAAAPAASVAVGAPVTEWAVVKIPTSEPEPSATDAAAAVAPAERTITAAADRSASWAVASALETRAAEAPAVKTPSAVQAVPSVEPPAVELTDADAPPADDEPPYEEPPVATAPRASQPRQQTSAAASARSVAFQEPQRYGEAVVREILGANFIEEQPAPGYGR